MMKRIHIVGCSPRSGTTLMAEMMGNCFEIDLRSDKERRITIAPPRKGQIFLTKTPKDIILVKEVLHSMKNFYVIYMLRDPRDIIVSKHPWDEQRYWSSLAFWKNYTPFGRELKDHPRFITIRYEDLVSKPDEVQQEIQRKMPFLRKKELFSNFHLNARPSPDYSAALCGLRPVSNESVGRWRKHKSRVLGQIRFYGSVSQELIDYGYEKDRSWEQELAGVVPDLSESHPSIISSEKYIRSKRRFNRLRAMRVWFNHSGAMLFTRGLTSS